MPISRHAPGTLGHFYDQASARLAGAGIETARLDARLLLAHALGRGPEVVIGYPERALTSDETMVCSALLDRRLAREPLSQILGKKEFWSLEFEVTPATLTPRPETELLVEVVMDHVKRCGLNAPRLLDLGTGTGCILIALLSELPNASGLGVDNSPAALEVAARNARRHGVAAEFILSDWFDHVEGVFDVIVSNPPYIPVGQEMALAPDVRDFEPPDALYAGVDGLDAYRVLALEAPDHLASDGIIALEHGAGQSSAIATLFKGAGFHILAQLDDLNSKDRVIIFNRMS